MSYTQLKLPQNPYIPGKGHKPHALFEALYSQVQRLEQILGFGLDLINSGFYWEAHEWLEPFWKKESDSQTRIGLQILILFAAWRLKFVYKLPAGKLRETVSNKIDEYQQQYPCLWQGIDLCQLKTILDVQKFRIEMDEMRFSIGN